MKYLILSLFMLLLGGASCQQEALPVPEDANEACFDSRPVVRKVDNLKGRVMFIASESMYAISYYVPGTIDSQWTGLVCNLPTEFRKEGIEVEFSGEYRSVQNEVKPMFGGEEMYYLFLNSVKEVPK